MTHLESLAQTDSQALKRSELEGFSKKWQHAKYPLHLAMYLDVLMPLKTLSLGLQKEEHDPVLILRRIQDFNWTMTKLKVLVDNAIVGNTNRLTNYTKLMQEITENEEGRKIYQGIRLKKYNSSNKALLASYSEIIDKLSSSVEERFPEIKTHPVFKHLITVLDIST